MKKKMIVFVANDKIDDFAHKLIDKVFGIRGAWMSNESTLDDFEEDMNTTSAFLLGKVEEEYHISMEDYPKDEPLYVWKVAEFVQRKLKES